MQPLNIIKSAYGRSGPRSWILVTMALLSLTAQAELPLNQRYLMYDRNGPTYQYQSDPTAHYTGTNNSTPTRSVQPMAQPQLIVAPGGNIITVPNTTTGRTQAIIGTGRYK
jgi:hypothetical protein